jgi:hypothetical protein
MADGKVGKLKNRMLHYTYTDLKTYMAKMDRYTTWSAMDKLSKTKKVTLFHLMLKPSYRFFTHYILRLGILDGKQGFVISAFSAYSVFMRYVKIMRLKENEKI